MTRLVIVAASLAAAALSTDASAHGGGLDANGCHTNRRTGEYHCHRGPTRAAPSLPPSQLDDRPGAPTQCGAKTYCSEMTSCQEARFYFTRCGLRRLDGDGDGVPCEKLCR